MTHAAKLTRHDALTEAIRATDAAIGDEQPTDQALRIIKALKRLRDDQPVRIEGLERVDYMTKAQELARADWSKKASFRDKPAAEQIGPMFDGIGGIDTPLGRLTATVWQQRWQGARLGDRICWAGSYTLDGEPITVAEIKAAWLAQRPTTRNRQRRA